MSADDCFFFKNKKIIVIIIISILAHIDRKNSESCFFIICFQKIQLDNTIVYIIIQVIIIK